MPNWVPITIDNLNAASVSGKWSAVQAAATAASIADPTARLIQQITNEIRGCIGFSGKWPLDVDTTTVPQSLVDIAARKIVREGELSLNLALTVDEISDEKLYQGRLLLITQGKWPIEKPDTAEPTPTVSPSTGATIASRARNRAGSRELKGLL